MTRCSSFSAVSTAGTLPSFSYSTPLWTRRVASPPSSRIMFGPPVGASGQVSACSVHHQYSSRVSPFQAKTGTPCGLSGVPFGPTAMAAAAWSWVEKMLQEAQRTCAPRATRVSMSTAVCTVMCREPVTRAPARGCASAYSLRIAIRPGISCSARVISLRPKSARERSATLKSCRLSTVVIASCSSGFGSRWVRLVCAAADTGVPEGGHCHARVHAAQSVGGPLSLGRSAVGPPDRHQQRRLAPSQATPGGRAAPSPYPKRSRHRGWTSKRDGSEGAGSSGGEGRSRGSGACLGHWHVVVCGR